MIKSKDMSELISEITKKINHASDIAIYCHTNPDGDAIGSMLALFFALKSKGKDVCCYCDTPIPQKYFCMAGSDVITFPEKRTHELAICVDCSELDRLGKCMKSFLSCKSQIAIDHHKTFSRFAPLCLVDTTTCSCAEVVYALIKHMKLLDKTVAELLFCGIVTDGACFSFPNVTKRTHEIVCDLLSYEFDSSTAIYNVYKSTSIEKFNLKNRVLSKTKFFADGSIAIITFDLTDYEATNASNSDSEGIINEIIDIDTVKVAFALSQVRERNYKLSIRTKGDVDASEMASIFGGGGHKNASGCRVNGFYEDIVERLVKIATDRI